MQRYDLTSTKPGPTRLLIGGIHGREWKATTPILQEFAEEGPPPSGRMIVVPRLSSVGSKHMSTLRRAYYETEEGKRMFSLVSGLKPEIYVELHCYKKSAYATLTNPERRKKRGVPPLIDLGNGLLIGSTSQFILPYLGTYMGIALEVPCRNKEKGVEVLDILRTMRDSRSTQEALDGLKAKYPTEISNAIRFFDEWFASSVVSRWQGGGRGG